MRKNTTIKGGGKYKSIGKTPISNETRRVEMQRSIYKARQAKRNGQSFEFVPIEQQHPYRNSHRSNETRRYEKAKRASMKSASRKSASKNGTPKSPKNS